MRGMFRQSQLFMRAEITDQDTIERSVGVHVLSWFLQQI